MIIYRFSSFLYFVYLSRPWDTGGQTEGRYRIGVIRIIKTLVEIDRER